MDQILPMENICHGCLSTDRTVSAIGSYCDILLTLIENKLYTQKEPVFCWECRALLKKLQMFQEQLHESQNALMQIINEQDLKWCSLSKLSKVKREDYNYEFEYFESALKVEVELSIKEEIDEGCSNTEILINDSVEDINDNLGNKKDTEKINTNNIETVQEKDNILGENKDNKDINEKLKNNTTVKNENETSDDDFEDKTMDEFFVEIKPKLRKKKQSKGKFIAFTEHCLLSRDKDKKGVALDDLVEVLQFGEQEMEDNILVKERLKPYHKMPHGCKRCKLGYLRELDLKRHSDLNHHNPKDPYTCSLCQKLVTSHRALDEHWLEHSAVNRCLLCSQVFRHNMPKHIGYRHRKLRIGCRECDVTFKRLKHFSDHYRRTHEKYICDICNNTFKRKNKIELHITRIHKDHKCNICDISFSNNTKLKRHRVQYHEPTDSELRFCVECNKQYATVDQYKNHLNNSRVHRSKPYEVAPRYKRVPCPECGKLTQIKNMKYHMNKFHTASVKYRCELCHKHFARPSGLRVHHKYVHLKEPRKAICECDICGKRFTSSRTLSNHRATHTGERPHKCEHCGASFIQKYAMKVHMQKIHAEYDCK